MRTVRTNLKQLQAAQLATLPIVREVTLTLPFSPSLNHYWRSVIVKGAVRLLISKDGRKFQKAVARYVLLNRVGRVAGRLGVDVVVHPPDGRIFDIDNRLKPLIDSIQEAHVIENDNAVDDLRIRRGHVVKPAGKVVVRVFELAVEGMLFQ